ncbi:ABC transporter permease [Janthinobacterium lividum]
MAVSDVNTASATAGGAGRHRIASCWYWVLLGLLGACLLPWHAQSDGRWLLPPALLLGEPASMAGAVLLLQSRDGGALPSLLLPLLLGWAAWRRRPPAVALLLAGAAGLLWLGLCAFAASGASMGPGQLACAASLLSCLALGLSQRGYFGGDAFVAGTVLSISLLVGVFTLVPTAAMLSHAFDDGRGGHAWTAPLRLLYSGYLWSGACLTGAGRCGTVWTTLFIAAVSALLCTLVGFALALQMARVRGPLARVVQWLSVLPLIAPPFVVGLAFILLFGRSGLFNTLLESWFGIVPGRWIYGVQGILLAQLFTFTPVACLVLRGVVEGISPALDEAAQTLRAGPYQRFFSITLPLAKPGLTSAFLICFVESLTDFGNPILLGGNTEVLATDIFFAIVGAQQDVGRAASLSALLLGLTLVALWLQRRVLGKASYATIGGKGAATRHGPLPVSLQRACGSAAILWSALTLLVFMLVLVGGFVVNWGRDYRPSMVHYLNAFGVTPGAADPLTGVAWESLLGTLGMALLVAPLGAVLGLLAGWVISRQQFPGKRLFEAFSFLPLAVPGTVIGVAYVLSFNGPPLELTGGAAIIVICLLCRNLPVLVQTTVAALAQVERSLGEASLTLGASNWQTLLRIELPLLRQALTGSLIYGFVRAMTTITAVIFLVSAGHELATTFIINRVINGDYGLAVAYSTLLIGLSLVVVAVVQRLAGRRRAGPAAGPGGIPIHVS